GLLIVGAILGRQGRQGASPLSSSYSASPRGLKALYLYLKESGIPAGRHLQSFHELPDGTGSMLVVSEPSRAQITTREAEDLLDWVRRGNFLLLASRCGEGVLRTELDAEILSRMGIECESQKNWRQELLPKRMDFSPTKFSLNKNVVHVSARAVSIPNLSSTEAAVVLQSGTAPAALFVQKGTGGVLFLASSSVLENSEIGRRNNLQFFWNFVRFSDIRIVYFDEFHHGFQQTFSTASRLRLRALSYTAALSVVLLILFTFAGGTRMGPPRKLLIRKGRSATETIESLSLLFLRGRKHRFLCRALQQNLLASLNKKCHLAKDLSNWTQFLEIHRGKIGEAAGLKQLLEIEFPSRVTPNFLQQYAAGVDHWRKKLRL
ncbi:MAG TPA: DUF4350 domain-containing protein, partial [Acidobacteriota bacterium]